MRKLPAAIVLLSLSLLATPQSAEAEHTYVTQTFCWAFTNCSNASKRLGRAINHINNNWPGIIGPNNRFEAGDTIKVIVIAYRSAAKCFVDIYTHRFNVTQVTQGGQNDGHPWIQFLPPVNPIVLDSPNGEDPGPTCGQGGGGPGL